MFKDILIGTIFGLCFLNILGASCETRKPSPPVYDSGMATCVEADHNAGKCVGMEAPGGVAFIDWCQDALFLDKACIAKAMTCEAALLCLEN